MWHPTDRARPEADECVSAVIGVALEIAPQSAIALRRRERIVWEREVIQPDAHIPRVLRGLCDGLGLNVSLDTIR